MNIVLIIRQKTIEYLELIEKMGFDLNIMLSMINQIIKPFNQNHMSNLQSPQVLTFHPFYPAYISFKKELRHLCTKYYTLPNHVHWSTKEILRIEIQIVRNQISQLLSNSR